MLLLPQPDELRVARSGGVTLAPRRVFFDPRGNSRSQRDSGRFATLQHEPEIFRPIVFLLWLLAAHEHIAARDCRTPSLEIMVMLIRLACPSGTEFRHESNTTRESWNRLQ